MTLLPFQSFLSSLSCWHDLHITLLAKVVFEALPYIPSTSWPICILCYESSSFWQWPGLVGMMLALISAQPPKETKSVLQTGYVHSLSLCLGWPLCLNSQCCLLKWSPHFSLIPTAFSAFLNFVLFLNQCSSHPQALVPPTCIECSPWHGWEPGK